MKKYLLGSLIFALFIAVSACSQSNQKNARSGDTTATYDSSGGVSTVLSDSDTVRTSSGTHLDENNDQRGTRLKGGPDSVSRKK